MKGYDLERNRLPKSLSRLATQRLTAKPRPVSSLPRAVTPGHPDHRSGSTAPTRPAINFSGFLGRWRGLRSTDNGPDLALNRVDEPLQAVIAEEHLVSIDERGDSEDGVAGRLREPLSETLAEIRSVGR